MERLKLPGLVWLVFFSSTLACLELGKVAGYEIRGYAWITVFVCSFLVLLRNIHKVTLPYLIWIPWSALVAIYLTLAEAPNALQRSMLLLCPISVGMAVSCTYIQEAELLGFGRLCRYVALVLLTIVSFKSGLILTGNLPRYGSFAAEMMLCCLLSVQFAADYALGKREALSWWAAMQALPIIALTRTAIVATGITLPFTLSPLKLKKRILILVTICIVGTAIFYSQRIQNRMFKSGQGTLSDVSLENPDFSTTGRMFAWQAITYRIEQRPWFGHGANASEPFLVALLGFSGQPHNDWLRLLYDYGIVGMAVFMLCMLAQVFHALKMARRATGECRILFYAGASSFIPFVIFMLTDNIILYAAFFGNMQFTMLGLAYAAAGTAKAEEVDEETEEDESEEPALAVLCGLPEDPPLPLIKTEFVKSINP